PSLAPYRQYFKGILPYVFLLQVVQQCGYELSLTEYKLFVNLAQKQDDLDRIVVYVQAWRDLSTDEQGEVLDLSAPISMFGERGASRYRRIDLDSSYAVAMFTYPRHLQLVTDDEGQQWIAGVDRGELDSLLEQVLPTLKIASFDGMVDWIAYLGDP